MLRTVKLRSCFTGSFYCHPCDCSVCLSQWVW